MEHPQKHVTEYLEKLIFRYLHIDSVNRQVRQIQEWETPDRIDALNIGLHFFELALYTFSRTILLEICKLISSREQISIIDWLNTARENADQLDISLYDPNSTNGRGRKAVPSGNYLDIIDKQLTEIDKHKVTIENLKGQRDKVIAHTDKAFFNDPKKMHEQFPLSNLDISALMETISNILHYQHTLLLHSDISMEVTAVTDVETVLNHVLAFVRIRRDAKKLFDCGIRVIDYMKDDSDKDFFEN